MSTISGSDSGEGGCQSLRSHFGSSYLAAQVAASLRLLPCRDMAALMVQATRKAVPWDPKETGSQVSTSASPATVVLSPATPTWHRQLGRPRDTFVPSQDTDDADDEEFGASLTAVLSPWVSAGEYEEFPLGQPSPSAPVVAGGTDTPIMQPRPVTQSIDDDIVRLTGITPERLDDELEAIFKAEADIRNDIVQGSVDPNAEIDRELAMFEAGARHGFGLRDTIGLRFQRSEASSAGYKALQSRAEKAEFRKKWAARKLKEYRRRP